MSAITKLNTTEFFFTKQDTYLNEYKNIVRSHYIEELGIMLNRPESDWNMRAIKRSGDTLIMMHDRQVIGGAMLYKSRGAGYRLLPLEDGRPILQEIYETDLSSTPYCEVGRLAVRQESRSMPLITDFIDHIVRQAWLQGMHYLFVLAPRANGFLYRRVCHKLKIEMTMRQFDSRLLPDLYRHLEFQLIRVNLLENYGVSESALQQVALPS